MSKLITKRLVILVGLLFVSLTTFFVLPSILCPGRDKSYREWHREWQVKVSDYTNCSYLELFYETQLKFHEHYGHYAELQDLRIIYVRDVRPLPRKRVFSTGQDYLEYITSRDRTTEFEIDSAGYRLFLLSEDKDYNSFLLTSDGKIRKHHEPSLNIDDYQELVIDLSATTVKDHFQPQYN